jgi:hypothetical protein
MAALRVPFDPTELKQRLTPVLSDAEQTFVFDAIDAAIIRRSRQGGRPDDRAGFNRNR